MPRVMIAQLGPNCPLNRALTPSSTSPYPRRVVIAVKACFEPFIIHREGADRPIERSWLMSWKLTRARPSRARGLLLAVVGLVCSGLVIAAGAERGSAQMTGSSTQEPASESRPPGPVDEFGRGTPRGTVIGFLQATRAHDYQKAAQYLDLRRLRGAAATTEGPTLARHLRVILDNTLLIDPDTVSDDPEGARDDGLPARRDLLGRIATSKGPQNIMLERVP